MENDRRRTACPLDCPDSCSLAVTVSNGRIVEIDGSTLNTPTGGYICAKVRKFGDRVYGDARLQYPAVRTGAKGKDGSRASRWDEAIELIADTHARDPRAMGRRSDPSVFVRRFERPADPRHARRRAVPPVRRVSARADGMRGADRRRGAVALRQDAVASPTRTIPEARLIVLWGVNPSTSGIHLVPYVREAQKRGARLIVIDPRSTPLARQADLHLAPRPGTDVAIALAIHRHLFEDGFADTAFLAEHTKGADRLRARAAAWTFERAAETAGVPRPRCGGWRKTTRARRRR